MTFLDLAKRIRQECAIAGNGPVTTVGQSGELLRVVDCYQLSAPPVLLIDQFDDQLF